MADRHAALLRWVVSARYQAPAGALVGIGQRAKGFVLQARWIVMGVMLASALVFPIIKQDL